MYNPQIPHPKLRCNGNHSLLQLWPNYHFPNSLPFYEQDGPEMCGPVLLQNPSPAPEASAVSQGLARNVDDGH